MVFAIQWILVVPTQVYPFYALKTRGVKTTATLVKYEKREDRNSSIVVRFADRRGQVHVAPVLGVVDDAWSIGDRIQVVYDPRHPDRVDQADLDRWYGGHWFTVFWVVSVGLIGLGLVVRGVWRLLWRA